MLLHVMHENHTRLQTKQGEKSQKQVPMTPSPFLPLHPLHHDNGQIAGQKDETFANKVKNRPLNPGTTTKMFVSNKVIKGTTILDPDHIL